MVDLNRVWIGSFLLCAAVYVVDVQSCATQAKIDKIDEIARNLTSLQSMLPENTDFQNPDHVAQYNALLNSLCTTYKPLLDEIAITAASCFELVLRVPSLLSLEIVGKKFTDLYTSFADIDEFCSCSSHLTSAWTVMSMEPLTKITNANVPLSPYADVAYYCESTGFRSQIAALNAGVSDCPALGKEAGMVDNARIAETQTFITDHCATFDKTKYECAISTSMSADFKACLANPPSNLISDLILDEERTRCGRRLCASKYLGMSCDAMGRDMYINAVNLQRADADLVIPTQDCEGCSSTLLMSAWSVAAMESMLKTVNSDAPLSPTAKLDMYCESTPFRSSVSTLATGTSDCQPLASEAGLMSDTRITEINTFITDKCATFDKAKFNCAMNTSMTADFKTCMANPPSNVISDSSDAAEKNRCGRRECTKTYIENSCDTSARNLYIDAVNLQRAGGDLLIASQDCENGAITITIATMTSLVILFIHCII